MGTFKLFRALALGCLISSVVSSAQTGVSISKQVAKRNAVARYISAAQWNELFPNRYGVSTYKDPNRKAVPKQDFYSYDAFCEAARHFPAFLNEGDETARKRELCAFLANAAQETSGGWDEAPGGYFKWGLYFKEEQTHANGNNLYTDTSKKNWLPVAGKSYHGRGPKQLSWNYNYGQFSEAFLGYKDSLLRHPELLATDPVISWASAVWFWMTPQPPKPSCHDVITGKWVPTFRDSSAGRFPGFGTTVNIINGGVECGKANPADKTTKRYEYYRYFCNYFKIDPGVNIDCNTQKAFTY